MQDRLIQTILSSEGSQQGDPDGSFLYCLGAALCLQRIAHILPLCYLGAIIDDLTVGTNVHNIPQVINVVSQSLEEYGIVLALQKCLIYRYISTDFTNNPH